MWNSAWTRSLVVAMLVMGAWCTRVDAQAQIGGVINDYAAVVDISTCSNVMRVDDASAFVVGDMVLIIQMQGAIVDSISGQVKAYAGAGRFERNWVAAIAGNDVLLERRISQPFDVSGAVQMVRMPVYQDVVIDAVVTCKAWDGRTGGVCAFAASGRVVLLNDIDVSGRGFRAAKGQRRGEGIALTTTALGDAVASAGSKCADRAGGGGAHHGAGGNGGCAGGYEASYTTGSNRIFMGAGGGGGESTTEVELDTLNPGSGGGIVLIDADAISGDRQHVIRAVGMNGSTSSRNAGGGGAGGAILLTAKTIENVPELVAYGGNGADAASQGAGGGGGGGAILLGTINPLNLNPSTYAGGLAGRSGSGQHGTDGTSGRVYPNCTINGDTTHFVPFSYSITPDTIVCPGESATVGVTGSVSVQWYDEAGMLICDTCTSITVTVTQPVTFTIIVRTPAGCRDTSVVTIGMHAAPVVQLTDPPMICPGDATTITAPDGFVHYAWSTGDTTQTITVTEPGAYAVTVQDSNGCSGSDTATLRHQDLRSVEIDAASVQQLVAPAGSMICRTVQVRNTTDTTVTVARAWMQRNVEFSVPLAQFPLVLTGRSEAPCTYCFSASIPNDYTDTLIVEGGCGRSEQVVRGTATESAWFTRCAVRITSDGEREEFVVIAEPNAVRAHVTDVMGRDLGEVLSTVIGSTDPGAVHRFDLSAFPSGILFLTLR